MAWTRSTAQLQRFIKPVLAQNPRSFGECVEDSRREWRRLYRSELPWISRDLFVLEQLFGRCFPEYGVPEVSK